MQIVVLGNERQEKELMQGGTGPTADLIWLSQIQELPHHRSADAVIDLLFENDPERLALLSEVPGRTVIINSVTDTLAETNPAFVRMGGWNTFLTGTIIEAASLDKDRKEEAAAVLAQLGKTVEWLPDTPGFLTPRVVSMIINEAYLAIAEGVSTPEEIDTAMKLGTNYPYGPVEWGRIIGLPNVVALLQKLAVIQPRYTPAAGLVQEIDKTI